MNMMTEFLPSKKIQNVFHFHLWAANMVANIKAATFGQSNKSERNQIKFDKKKE